MTSFRVPVILALVLTAHTARSEPLIFNTEDYYPYNYLENGKITGTSTRIVALMAEKAGVSYRLVTGPWQQSFSNALSQNNNCVFSAIFSEERKDLFKWVLPIDTMRMVIYKLKDSPLTANTLDDLKDHTIGGYSGDASASYLKLRGFRVDETTTDSLNPMRLRTKRIDAWATSDFLGPKLSREAGVDVEPLLVVSERAMGLACNKSIDDITIKKLQDSLDEMNKNGELEKIRSDKK